MFKKLVNTLHALTCAVLIFQLVGCGTIMYPERKGQKSGKIDAGVAILDGIGLLLFIIPGVIAFAVDFNNGTIYLPGTSSSSLELKDIKQVKFDPKRSSIASIERIIKRETGYQVKLYQNNTKIAELKSVDDMMVQFVKILPRERNNGIASIR
ncbi:MAG: hypothetical protein NUV91_02850 [Candidatus Omnitrophica bacterium]|nr:hypothetical protein [Candidatus Omnitrophota bacterium]